MEGTEGQGIGILNGGIGDLPTPEEVIEHNQPARACQWRLGACTGLRSQQWAWLLVTRQAILLMNLWGKGVEGAPRAVEGIEL
jgi:hypothetical protein